MLKRLLKTLLFAGLIYVLFFFPDPPVWLVFVLAGVEIIIFLWVIVTVRKGLRNSRGTDFEDRVTAVAEGMLPPRVAVFFLSEVAVFLACFRWLTRRPVIAPKQPDSFTSMNSSQYGFLFAGLMLATFFELPIVHILIAYYMNPAYAITAHSAVVVLHLYGLLWLLGDYRLMRESAHILKDEGLFISLGLRYKGLVPLKHMSGVAELNGMEPEQPGIKLIKVTPYDETNMAIFLDRDVSLTIIFGITKSCRQINLYVDEPQKLLSALQTRLAPTA